MAKPTVIKKLNKLDFFFLTFLLLFITISLFLLNTPPTPDEGTHSLISLFFHDILTDLSKVPTLSFSKIYDYTISYLVHYPKLSLYYPPLLHIIVSVFYRILDISFFTGRLAVLIFSVATLILLYRFLGRLFNKRTALFVTILFSIMPMVYYSSITVMTDIPYMFFFLLSAYIYLKALDSNNKKYFIIASIVTSLAFFTKWNSILIIPIIFIYTLFEKRHQLKNVTMSIIFTFIIISPYLLILWKTGLISIPLLSSLQVSATAKQDPQFTSLQGWIYYAGILIKNYFTLPLFIASTAALIFYAFKKEKYWKFLIIWFLTYYIFFTILSNKEPRYMIPLIPTLITPLVFFILSQKPRLSIPLVMISIVILSVSTWQFISASFYYNPDFVSVAKETLKSEGNIVVVAEPSWFYSSQFIFTLASLDENEKFVYRACSLSSTTPNSLFSEYGVKYLIVPKPSDRDIDKIELIESLPNLKLDKEFSTDTTNVFVYTYSDTMSQKQYCNFICVLNTTVCTKYVRPVDALR